MTTTQNVTQLSSATFPKPHRATMAGYFFGRDNTEVEVLTYWFGEGSDAVQAASDLRSLGCDARARKDNGILGAYKVVAFRKLAA